MSDVAKRLEREKTAMRQLESLTPSGSEFVEDPERCAAFIRDYRDSQHRMIVKFKLEADEAKRQLRELAKVADSYQTAIRNGHNDLVAGGPVLRKLLAELEIDHAE